MAQEKQMDVAINKKDKVIRFSLDLTGSMSDRPTPRREGTMSSLPRITPMGTPRSVSANPTGYVAYPPPELTSTWNHMKFPSRLNPLAPPHPKRRINMSWETTPQHWHNEKRRLAMQQREHERYHSAWAKPFYGPPADKEAYRRYTREVLKKQMSDSDDQKKEDFKIKVKESVEAVDYDNQCKMQDYNDFVKKFSYLTTFRDHNKTFMEDTWDKGRFNKIMTDKYDREVMRYNPINWSGTLS